VLLRAVAGKGFQHENHITVFCSKEPGNTVEIVFFDPYAFILLTSTIVPGINYSF